MGISRTSGGRAPAQSSASDVRAVHELFVAGEVDARRSAVSLFPDAGRHRNGQLRDHADQERLAGVNLDELADRGARGAEVV